MLWTLLYLLTTVGSRKLVVGSEDSSASPSTPPANVTTTLYPLTDLNNTKTEEKAKFKTEATAWKIDTAFSTSDSGEKNETLEETGKPVTVNVSKEFKPSPQLVDFFEVAGLESPPTQEPSFGSNDVIKDYPKFSSSLVDHRPHESKDFLPPEFPYRLESPGAWRPSSPAALPTVETPVQVPAGGLYQLPAIKHTPGPAPDDIDLDLFHKDNHSSIKKHAEPWQRALQLAAALLPVGLLVSALVPGVVSVRDPPSLPPPVTHPYSYGSQLFQRRGGQPGVPGLPAMPPLPALPSLPSLPDMSERCRRRLLCELHADHHYITPDAAPRRRACRQLSCEDSATLSAALHLLLHHHAHTHPHNHPPADT